MGIVKMNTRQTLHPILGNLLNFATTIRGNDLSQFLLDMQSGTISEENKEMFAIILRDAQRLAENIDAQYQDILYGQLIPSEHANSPQYA